MTADFNALVLLVIAVANALAAYFSWRAHQAMLGVKSDVATIEKATNSMKDALVAATAKSSKAEGVLLGRAEVQDEKK